MIATIPTARLTHVSPLGHARSRAGAAVVQFAVIVTRYSGSRNEVCECCLNDDGGDGCAGALRFMATTTQGAVVFIYEMMSVIVTAVVTTRNVETAHNPLHCESYRKVLSAGDGLEVRSRSCS